MAKHIVVCLFCFLCATHSCASHEEVKIGYKLQHNDPSHPPLLPDSIVHEDLKSTVILSELTNNKIKTKVKRDISNINEFNKIEDEYLKKLFSIYGDGNSLNIEGFEKLMKRLDLIEELSMKLDGTNLEHIHLSSNTTTDQNTTRKNCLVRKNILTSIKNESEASSKSLQIDSEVIKKACPAILYTMIVGGCLNDEASHLHHDIDIPVTTTSNRLYAWLYSMLAVALISACGLLGLAVIPVMQKRFYQPLLQFLVALAVGTLAGDALLHLLPHAMSDHSHEHDVHGHNLERDNHDKNMWKGFVAMLGLILFFLMERIIMLAAKWRKKQQLKDKQPSRLKVIKPEQLHSTTTTQLTSAADKQCKHKYSSFPYCYDEIKMDMEGNNDDHHVFNIGAAGDHQQSHNNAASTGLDELGHHSNLQACKIGHSHKMETNQNMTECPNITNYSKCNEINRMSAAEPPDTNNCSEINKMINSEINKMLETDNNKEDTDSMEYTVILREHESGHHGHSHTHGHVHAAPKTMSSVAWMVIMGDGLHNFTDGMAIGAAFSSSIAGGFSTAVAVFCHELPHELGDFAMLLKAGMSMKQAVVYNLLSSFLCLFGNIFGMWLGTTESATSWVFAAAAGMFLYIALVDMIPELSSGHESEGTFLQCILHLGGLLIGFGVMALIALYEHDLKSIFHEP